MINYLIVKVTGHCNLRCNYCYYMKGLDKPYRIQMPVETVSQLLRNFSAYVRDRQIPSVRFAWHGGEPLLAGEDYFRRVFSEQVECFGSGVDILNMVQTNGTLISEQWAKLFMEYDASVGISIDGPTEAHDRRRKYPDKTGSYQDVVRGIEILQRFGVSFGAIVTLIDPTLNGRELFQHLHRLGIRKINFNIPVLAFDAFQDRYGSGGVEAFGDFMNDVFDAWLAEGDRSVEVESPITHIRLLGGFGPTCCHAANNCDRYVTIEPNGDVGTCENLRSIRRHDSNGRIHLVARNVKEHSFHEMEAAIQGHFEDCGFNELCDTCKSCSIRDYCNGGCPLHRYRVGSGFRNPSYFCEYYKVLIEHFAKRLVKELDVA